MTLLTLMLGISSALLLCVQASEVGDVPDTASIVYVGVRDDAKPFSYRATDGADESILSGFGGFMIEVCRHVLQKMSHMPEFEHLDFRASVTSASDRFKELDKNGHLLMLCGPDSITEERLKQYHVSHPVFQSGMTYAYVNPRSRLFPRGGHCKNIIGVVRGTTADLHGLADLAGRNILMRFDDAVDLELNKTHEKLEMANETMRKLVQTEVNKIETGVESLHELQTIIKDRSGENVAELLDNHDGYPWAKALKEDIEKADEVQAGDLKDSEAREHVDEKIAAWLPSLARDVEKLQQILTQGDPHDIHTEIESLDNSRLTARLNARMRDAYRHINTEFGREIVTGECPGGFTALPIRKYPNHNAGVEGLCTGKVLYYLGDYDIINSKVSEFSDCDDVVLERFTRSKEVYGVFFSKQHTYRLQKPTSIVTDENHAASDVGGLTIASPADDQNAVTQDSEPDSSDGTIDARLESEHDSANSIDVPHFYTTFNNLLLQSMQGRSSDIEAIFESEFVEQEKSAELKAFFDNFKISSFEN